LKEITLRTLKIVLLSVVAFVGLVTVAGLYGGVIGDTVQRIPYIFYNQHAEIRYTTSHDESLQSTPSGSFYQEDEQGGIVFGVAYHSWYDEPNGTYYYRVSNLDKASAACVKSDLFLKLVGRKSFLLQPKGSVYLVLHNNTPPARGKSGEFLETGFKLSLQRKSCLTSLGGGGGGTTAGVLVPQSMK